MAARFSDQIRLAQINFEIFMHLYFCLVTLFRCLPRMPITKFANILFAEIIRNMDTDRQISSNRQTLFIK